MTIQPEGPQGKTASNVVPGIVARASQIVVVFASQAAILFLAAGRADWLWAWLFLGIYTASIAANSFFEFRHHCKACSFVTEHYCRFFPAKFYRVIEALDGFVAFAQFHQRIALVEPYSRVMRIKLQRHVVTLDCQVIFFLQ